MVGAVPSKERNTGLFDPVYGMALCPVEGKDAGIVASTFQPKLRLATAIVMSEAVGPSDVRGGISLRDAGPRSFSFVDGFQCSADMSIHIFPDKWWLLVDVQMVGNLYPVVLHPRTGV